MSRDPAIVAVVEALLGTWVGHGEGGYPTIEEFRYREQLVFLQREDHPAIHYEQRTWKDASDGEVVSHWETGLVRISSDGSVSVFNAQGGRAESLTGAWRKDDSRWEIQLGSTGFAGDQRVLRSQRTWSFDSRSFNYRHTMATTTNRDMDLHLTGELVKLS